MPPPVDKPLAFPPDDEAAWQRLARGYRLAGLLLSSHRLGILQRLTEGPATLDALAGELEADRTLLEHMCRALASAGLLASPDGGWELSEEGRRLAADPAATAELDSLALDYQYWGQLDRRARAPADEPADPPPDEARAGTDIEAARRYALRLAARHRRQAVRLLREVVPTRPVRVMDVGGAEGFLAREVCARWPDAECVVLEDPPMAEVARRACAGEPRISVIEGDFVGEGGEVPVDELPTDADVVVLSHVLQGRPDAPRRVLTARAAAALRAGGCLLSCESVLRSDAGGPLDTILWAVGQSAVRRGGEMMTTVDQDVLLRAVGLAATAAWWVSDSSRAVLGVKTEVGVEPALRAVAPA